MHALPLGVFGVAACERRGLHRRVLSRLQAQGELTRLRRGAYVRTDVWAASTDDARRRLRIEAELLLRPSAIASHTSALALHGLPLVREPVRRIDLACGVSRPRIVSGIYLHPDDALPRSPTQRAVSIAAALAQTASLGWFETAVVAGDAALFGGRLTLDELRNASESAKRRERTERLIDAMDPASESPGESLLRLILREAGFDVETQVRLETELGPFRVDFLVEGVVVEFDGQIKYAGDDSGAALFAEKRREDALRAAGYRVVRVVWSDLSRPESIVARVSAQVRAD